MNIDATVSCGVTRDWHIEITVTMRARSTAEIRPTEGAILYVVVEDKDGTTVGQQYLPQHAQQMQLQQGASRSYTYELDELVSDTSYAVRVYAVGLVLPLGVDHQQLVDTTINPAQA